MRRVALVGLLAFVLAACGGAKDATPPASPSPPAPAKPAKTQAQLAAEQLLKELDGDCGCTAEVRARDRIENGLVEKPDSPVLLTPAP